MKKGPILLCVLLWSICLSAQQDITLPGLVVRQNSRVKTGQVEYLSKVNIKATQAAPTLSDGRGQFSLVFSDKPAYNVTRIFAEKSGMEVVNKTDLERAAVVGRLQKLKIVMCPAGEMMENQMVYYGIAEEAIVKRFKTRIAKLEAANTGLDNRIAEINKEFNLDLKTKTEAIYALEKERSEALASAQETAQKFAAINLDDADSLYLQADAAFKKGDFNRVLQLLQYNQLDKNIRNIRSNLSSADSLSAEGRTRMARGQENLRQTIQNALFAARVAKLDGAWNRAEAYYDLAVRADVENVEAVVEAAIYFTQQNQLKRAKSYYTNLLTKLSDQNQRATVFGNLANLLRDNYEIIQAKQYYEEALQIWRKQAEVNPEFYQQYVVEVLNNLGVLLKDNNQPTEAKKVFEEALQFSRKLAGKYPDIYMPYVAGTLDNLGLLLVTHGYPPEGAKKAFSECIEIYRQLSGRNPDNYLLYLAKVLGNYASFLSDIKDTTEARRVYQEDLIIWKQLTQKNPDAYLPDMAAALNNWGVFLSDIEEMAAAKRAYEESLTIRRELAKKDPDVYLPFVANTLNNLALLLKDTRDLVGAKQSYEEALLIYRNLAVKNPQTYNLRVLIADVNMGIYYEFVIKETGDMSLKASGMAYMQDAVIRLATYPESFTTAYKHKPRIESLINFFQTFDETAFNLKKLMEPISVLETANQTEKDPHRKVQRQQEILGLLSEIEKVMPDNQEVANRMAQHYGGLAWYQLFIRQFAEAEQSARTGLAKDPGEEWINTNLALALLFQSKWEAAKQIYLSLKDKKYGDGTYKTSFLSDLDELEQAGISHPDVKKVRALLGEK